MSIEEKLKRIYGAKTLPEWVKECHEIAKEHGWHEKEVPFAETVVMCHSELSEAIDSYRKGEKAVWLDGEKPEGWAVEMADCVIRIFDWAGEKNIDLDEIIRIKCAYNSKRSWRHGGRLI